MLYNLYLDTQFMRFVFRVSVTLTAPVLVLSTLQPGMILESITIQLLILSLLRLSTMGNIVQRIRANVWGVIWVLKKKAKHSGQSTPPSSGGLVESPSETSKGILQPWCFWNEHIFGVTSLLRCSGFEIKMCHECSIKTARTHALCLLTFIVLRPPPFVSRGTRTLHLSARVKRRHNQSGPLFTLTFGYRVTRLYHKSNWALQPYSQRHLNRTGLVLIHGFRKARNPLRNTGVFILKERLIWGFCEATIPTTRRLHPYEAPPQGPSSSRRGSSDPSKLADISIRVLKDSSPQSISVIFDKFLSHYVSLAHVLSKVSDC